MLNLPGMHNVLNALATIAVADELGVDLDAAAKALSTFGGVQRRFTIVGETGGVTVVDDYGHHPAEIEATLDAAQEAYGRRVVVAFQPHRYTRTRDVFEDFVRVLSSVDALLLTEVYAAGETPIVAADGRALARAVRVLGKVEPIFIEQVGDLPQAIIDMARPDDVVLTMVPVIGAVPASSRAAAPATTHRRQRMDMAELNCIAQHGPAASSA